MKKIDLDEFNSEIKEATATMVDEIQLEAGREGIEHVARSPSKGASVPKIKAKLREEEGAINNIAIGVRRSLVYRHKGAGKGRGGTKGSSWLDKYNKEHKTKDSSKGKMGTGGRTAAPFINTALDNPDKGVPHIANIAAEHLGDAIVNNILVK